MARKRKIPVTLDGGQRAELERVGKSGKEEARRVRRARILLMAADGATDAAIAEAVGLNRNSVRATIAKSHEVGPLAALDDMARSGRPALISDDDKAWVAHLACTKPKDLGYAQELWTVGLLTAHVRGSCTAAGHPALAGVARSKVWAILDGNDLKPHRASHCLERRDEDFERKMEEVLLVYRAVAVEIETGEGDGAVTVSYDEKPGIQALEGTAPDLPPSPGAHPGVGRDYEYKRLGTLSLLAGMNLVTGEVTGLVRDRHRSAEFIEWLRAVDERYAEAERIRVVLDNHSAHTSKETRAFLATRPGRFEFVFTPKHGSWLNLVESFFGKLARVCLRGIRVGSKEELAERIMLFLDEVNAAPVVYRWKYRMEDMDV